jgi:Bacterial transcriptional activator domain
MRSVPPAAFWRRVLVRRPPISTNRCCQRTSCPLARRLGHRGAGEVPSTPAAWLERFCQELAARGRYAEAVQAGLTAVTGESFQESAHRVVIQAHLAEGDRFEAVRAFHSFRRLLQQEMGLEPANELKALVQPFV